MKFQSTPSPAAAHCHHQINTSTAEWRVVKKNGFCQKRSGSHAWDASAVACRRFVESVRVCEGCTRNQQQPLCLPQSPSVAMITLTRLTHDSDLSLLLSCSQPWSVNTTAASGGRSKRTGHYCASFRAVFLYRIRCLVSAGILLCIYISTLHTRGRAEAEGGNSELPGHVWETQHVVNVWRCHAR